MSESEKPFTVSDRRHFTPDGRLKDAAEDEDRGPSPSPPPPETRPAEPAATEPRSRAVCREDTALPPAGEAEFSQFLLSLGAQAGMLLSGQGMPEGTDRSVALAGARSIISILEMLKGKTEGRRTPEEDEVLEGLLFELRMAYVDASRTSPS
jgi:hypothetical protein